MKNGVDYFSYTIQKRGNSHLDGPIAGSRHDLPVVGAEGNGEHVLCGERSVSTVGLWWSDKCALERDDRDEVIKT